MKLYATTKSERASKGQGGNKHIIIELQRDRTKLSHVIEYTVDGLRVSAMTDNGGVVVYEEGAKCEVLDGGICKVCGVRVADNIDIHNHYYAPALDKGEKQKGETTIEDLDREAETRRDIDSMLR